MFSHRSLERCHRTWREGRRETLRIIGRVAHLLVSVGSRDMRLKRRGKGREGIEMLGRWVLGMIVCLLLLLNRSGRRWL
jgi:hypothetical protein